MKLNRSVLAVGLVALLASCSKDVEPNIPTNYSQLTEQSSYRNLPINIELEADVRMEDTADATRNLSYKVGTNGIERDVLQEKSLHSLCVISDEDGTTRYYVPLEWTKTAGKNHFYIKKEKVRDYQGNNIQLDHKKKWFISGYLTYNPGNISGRNISYEPNQLKPLTGIFAGESQTKDIPLHFTWVPLKLTNNGEDASALTTDSGRAAEEKIVIKPFGVMMRIKLTNQETYAVKIRSLRLMSTVITPQSGVVKTTLLSAPNVPATLQKLPYEPLAELIDHQMPLDAPVTLSTGATHSKEYLIWGMPVTPNSSTIKRQTHLLADVKRLDTNGREMTYPKMSTLYVWGSDSNNPRHQTRRLIHAQVYRPKMPLEYMSNGYLTVRNTFASQNTAVTPLLKVSYPALEASTLPAGYRILTTEDARTIAPTVGTSAIKFFGDNILQTYSSEFVINGVTKQYNETLQSGETIYALRFDDGKDNRRQYSAWRYGFNGVIEAIYLGPNFKGDFEDIKNPEFWTLHQDNIIKKTYGPEGTKYTGLGGTPLPETNPQDTNYTKEKADGNRNEALALLSWVKPVNDIQRIFVANLSKIKGIAQTPSSYKAFLFVTFDLQYLKAEQIAPAILIQDNNTGFPNN